MAENARGSSNILDQQAAKMWGQLESDAYREFWSKAKPIDMSKYLEAETTIVPHFIYQDAVLTANAGRGITEAQQRLMLNKDDVLLGTHPKTGSTWVQEVLYNLFHKDEIDKPLTEAIDIRVPYIEFPECGFQELQSRPSPRLVKAHVPYDLLPKGNCDRKYKIVYCIRNPKDTFMSMYHFYKMMAAFQFNGSLKEYLNLWVNDKTFFGSYGFNVLSYWNRRHQDNIHIVRYEDMQKDVHSEIRKLAKFLGIEVDDATVDKIAVRCGFQQMSTNPLSNHAQWTEIENMATNKDLTFMRKGKVGDWKNNFDEETNRIFDEWLEKTFGKSDITFDYEI